MTPTPRDGAPGNGGTPAGAPPTNGRTPPSGTSANGRSRRSVTPADHGTSGSGRSVAGPTADRAGTDSRPPTSGGTRVNGRTGTRRTASPDGGGRAPNGSEAAPEGRPGGPTPPSDAGAGTSRTTSTAGGGRTPTGGRTVSGDRPVPPDAVPRAVDSRTSTGDQPVPPAVTGRTPTDIRPTANDGAAAAPATGRGPAENRATGRKRPRAHPATEAPDTPDAETTPEPPPPTTATARRRRRLGRNRNTLRLVVAILAALVVAATGTGAATRSGLDGAVVHVDALDRQSPAIKTPALQAGDENVLVLTTDFPTPDPTAGSLVVAHVPRDSDSVAAMSLPSDLEINRPPCERWEPRARDYVDETVPAEVRTTLLSAFEVGGPRCLTRVVQQLTGIAVSRFVAVDRAGVAAMARAVGIDPCPPGPPPIADRGRIERDHGQLRAVLSRTLSFATLLAPPRLHALAEAIPGAVLADQVDLGRLLGISQALDGLEADRITFTSTPVAAARNSRGHSELRESEADALFEAVREDTALPAHQDPRSATGAPAPRPQEVTVDVLNASGRGGLAKGAADRLAGVGFVVDEVGNAQDATDDTVITFSPDRAAAAEVLASSVPGATLRPEPTSSDVLELTLGGGFDDLVRAPGEEPVVTPAAAGPGCA